MKQRVLKQNLDNKINRFIKKYLVDKYVLIILSSSLTALSYPPLHLGFLAYFSFVPLLFTLWETDGIETFKYSYIWAFVYSLLSLHWISWIGSWPTFFGTILSAVYIAFFPATLLWLVIRIKNSFYSSIALILFPFLWIGMEYIRSLTDLGFPWQDLANTQTYYLYLIQFADLLGSSGVSFWIILLNIFFFLILKRRKFAIKFIYLIILITLYLAPYLYGKYVMDNYRDIMLEDFNVALLQGNIDPRDKWDRELQYSNLDSYISMMEAVGDSIKLVIWPESATASYYRRDDYTRNKIRATVNKYNRSALVGVLDYKFDNNEVKYYNSAVMVNGDGTEYWYYKNKLVPFGEHFPFDQHIKFLQKLNGLVDLGQGDFSPGTEIPLFNHYGYNFGVIICFESIFSNYIRDLVNKGAKFLVLITNDGWFGKSAGAYQHASIAQFRAIENRIPIARCANTGISGIIDPFGYYRAKIGLMDKGVIESPLYFTEKKSLYTNIGPIFPRISALIIPLVLLIELIKHIL